jgi:predicted phage-related endonuclease
VKILAVDQRSDAWRQARLGRITGSRAADLVATIKSGEAAARRDYRIELVCERLTGISADDGYVSKDMQRGTDLEQAAFAAYEARTGRLVRKTGFIAHDVLMAGCSLDGDVNECRGFVELKCPKSATHLRYLRSGSVPSDYLPQITHNLWITGAEWCDFVSFDDRFPPTLQFFRVRVPRDDRAIAAYEAKAVAFLAEVDRECEALATMASCVKQLEAAVRA